MCANLVPEGLELPSWNHISLDIVSDCKRDSVQGIVFLIGTYLFLSVHIDLSDSQAQRLLDFGQWVITVRSSPIDDQVHKLLISILDRVTISQWNDSLDGCTTVSLKSINFHCDFGEDLVFQGVLDSILDNDHLVIEMLHGRHHILSRAFIDLGD